MRRRFSAVVSTSSFTLEGYPGIVCPSVFDYRCFQRSSATCPAPCGAISMRIAVIEAGNVGGGLGAALAHAGHVVAYGVRDPGSEKCRAALSATPGSIAALAREAVDGADVVISTLRPDGVLATVAELPSLEGAWSSTR